MFRTSTDVTRTAVPAVSDDEVDDDEDKKYICDICADGWSSETEVFIHRASSHRKYIDEVCKDEKPVCKMCIADFESHDEVLKHIKSEHLLSSETAVRVEREIFVCDDCHAIFFNKLLLMHHIQCSHMPRTDATKFKCPVCLKKVKLTTSWYHFKAHNMQSIACCMICCKKFKDRYRLRQHMKSHPSVLKCEICSYVTKNKEYFDEHLKTVHEKIFWDYHSVIDYKQYYIPRESPKTWKMLSLMGWRGRKLTNDVRVCVLCREICTDDINMRYHLLQHMNQGLQTLHLCSCGMTFSSMVLLKHHKLKSCCLLELA